MSAKATWRVSAAVMLSRVAVSLWLLSGAQGEVDPVTAPRREYSIFTDQGYPGDLFGKAIPIGELSASIGYERGIISLVADPADRSGKPRYGDRGERIVVYLVNDTDEAIPRAIGTLEAGCQVRVGENWFPREELRMHCGSVPPPRDLPARSALALVGLSDRWGDTDGEIRYFFRTIHGVIKSPPMHGRHQRATTEENMRLHLPVSELRYNLEAFLEDKWRQSMIARNPEEFCAMLELSRHHRLFLDERGKLSEWILDKAERRNATPAEARAMRRIKVLLAKPWVVNNDGEAFAWRCLSALEAAPSKAYGTPEKCKEVVWRLLSRTRNERSSTLLGYEVRPISEDSILRLVKLARDSLDSGDSDIADGAAEFLSCGMVTEVMFSSGELLGFVENGKGRRIHVGLSGLSQRSRIRDAIPWLLGRLEADDPNLGAYYRHFELHLSRQYGAENKQMEDWEKAVILRLFEREPLKALEIVSLGRISRHLKVEPSELGAKLRSFLQGELSEGRIRWWAERSASDSRGVLEPENQADCRALGTGIQILDALDDPQDVPLLEAMLKHPAATADGYAKRVTYVARYNAKECLQRRKIDVPDSVVTQLELKPPPPPRDYEEDFAQYVSAHQKVIVGGSLLALAGACLVVWLLRAFRKRAAQAA